MGAHAARTWQDTIAAKADAVSVLDTHAPLVIVGPSGVGKGTLISKLMESFPNSFGFSVSSTTRKPREGEENGVHYHFKSRDEMEKEIEEGKFVEHAVVHTNIYGTSKAALDEVSAAGKIAVLDIDVQGAVQVKQKLPNAHFVFIMPPSLEVLESRLRGRGTETEDKIKVRLSNAQGEIQFAKDRADFFDRIVVNDDDMIRSLPEIRSNLLVWHAHLSK